MLVRVSTSTHVPAAAVAEPGPMVIEKAPARSSVVVVLLVLSALVGAGTALILYIFLIEYGPTSGSRVDGAVQGLTFAAVPLLVAGVLAAVAFGLGRRSSWVRSLAVAAAVLSVCGVLVAGAQAAVGKYDRLAKVPDCGTAEVGGSPGARVAREAFADLEHPGPFGASWNGIQGCGADLLNVTFAEAAAHYRDRLPAAGWAITRDNSSELAARRNDLIFVLTERCGPVSVEMRLADAGDISTRC